MTGQSKSACLVQAHIVRPAVEGRQALVAGPRAAAAIAHAVGAGAVPGHADEEPPVVAPIGRPPILRIGHQRIEILLHSIEVEFLEFFCVVESFTHRIGLGGVLVQNIQVQLVRPPVPVRSASAGHGYGSFARYRTLFLVTHEIVSFRCINSMLRQS